MTDQILPRRSVLYMPGANERALEKAKGLSADALILDQLIYKWRHSRMVLHSVLLDKYSDLMTTGWRVKEADLQRDVARLLSANFKQFVGLK